MPFHVVSHPLVRHKLGLLRRADTSTTKFRDLTREITCLLSYEAFRDLDMERVTVQGWAGDVEVEKISGKKVAVVPILRAGIGMLQGVLDLIPAARVNVVGLYRNEDTLEPVEYYVKVPALEGARVIILEPMLATGGSLAAAISLLKARGAEDIRVICIIASPEGTERVAREHPDVKVFCASMDEHLDENGFIIPGLGDCGDRLYGTR